MNFFLKKIIFPLAIISFIFSCSSEDDSSSIPVNGNEDEEIVTPNKNGQGFGVNIRALRRVNPDFSINNLMSLGESNIDLLTSTRYRSITLEIVSVTGFEPSPLAKESLLQFIEDRLNKPDGVRLVERSIDPPLPDTEAYDVPQIFEEIEAKNRTQFSNGSDLAIFLFYSDKPNINNEMSANMSSVVLGTAYLNTSFVIYKETIQRLTVRNPSLAPIVEAGTLNHEFAHLLGLSGTMGTPDTAEGGHTENGHCTVPFCLMEATASLARDMMNQPTVLQLDPLCIRDLQAVGGK